MKALIFFLGFAVLLFGGGCINMKVSDGTRREPTKELELFTRGQLPTRPFKEIAEMSFRGNRDDESRARKRFIREAKDLGGNGLIFEIESPGPTAGSKPSQETAWLFKGKVIVYE